MAEQVDLQAYSVDDLLHLADEQNVPVPDGAPKAEIIRRLNLGEAAVIAEDAAAQRAAVQQHQEQLAGANPDVPPADVVQGDAPVAEAAGVTAAAAVTATDIAEAFRRFDAKELELIGTALDAARNKTGLEPTPHRGSFQSLYV